MTQSEKLDYVKELFLATDSLYTWHFSPDMELLSHNCPLGEHLKDMFILSDCFNYMKQYVTGNDKPLALCDDLSFSWFVVPSYAGKELDSLYLVGPACASHTSDGFIKEKMDSLNMSVQAKRIMPRLLSQIPVIPPLFFDHYACQFYYTLTGNVIALSDVSYQLSVEDELLPAQTGELVRHNSYQYECLMLKNVEDGNQNHFPVPDGLVQCGLMCPGNPLRQTQDEMLVYTALVTRAAIRGGYTPENAYARSDHYIQAIEAATTIPEVRQIGVTMYSDFISRVHDAKQKPVRNALVRKCMDYLDTHLTEKIDLDALAQELGYTKYYLTRRFKEETKTGIAQYLLKKRIAYAQTLLTDSRISVLEISEKLQFSSPSHFTSIFHKMTGTTPTEYRQNF